MSSRTGDPLLDTLGVDSLVRADRLHYATGELLGADDLAAEQTYHRRQLARALFLLHGSGSVAGLEVAVRLTLDNATPRGVVEATLEVSPGMAIDRVGRLIEVSRPHTLRLRRWFEQLAGADPERTAQEEDDRQDLVQAFHPHGQVGTGAIVADVFLGFHACDRSPAPAFATGPFDALDASQPSRTRDAHEFRLVLRKEADVALNEAAGRPVTFDPWAAAFAAAGSETSVEGTLQRLRRASLKVWEALQSPEAPPQDPWHEYPPFVDRTAVLLARVRVPAELPTATGVPQGRWTEAAWSPADDRVNNFVRDFVIPPAVASRVAASITF